MSTPPPTGIRVGLSIPPAGFASHDEAATYVQAAAEAGLDHLVTADHISFFGGRGRDGLMTVSWLAGLHPTIGVYVGVYLLALRHPVAVARQVSTLADQAPGRLTFGVGVGGEDRHEMEVVAVDPATRGRRTDEALDVLRPLLAGETGEVAITDAYCPHMGSHLAHGGTIQGEVIRCPFGYEPCLVTARIAIG